MPAWLLLAIAIVPEVIGTTALRESDGFSRPLPAIVVVVTYALSSFLLALVLRELSAGFTYAVWAGAGTALIVVIGVLAFGEALGVLKVAGVVLVIAGIVVLSLAGAH